MQKHTGDGTTAVEVSQTAEDQARKGETDPMPPEGTDEHPLHGRDSAGIRQDDRVRATRAVIESGLTHDCTDDGDARVNDR